MDPVPHTIYPENFLGYSREKNPGPLGWYSDMVTTTPQRRSLLLLFIIIIIIIIIIINEIVGKVQCTATLRPLVPYIKEWCGDERYPYSAMNPPQPTTHS